MRYADSKCVCTEAFEPEHVYIFTGPCVVTKKEVKVTVKGPELFAYRQGAHIQDAFPNLTPSDREFLMSGFSEEGWKLAFGGDDEDGETVDSD